MRVAIEYRKEGRPVAEDLASALDTAGYDVRLRRVYPTRGVVAEGLEVAVRLLDAVEGHAVDALAGAAVTALTLRFRHRKSPSPSVPLYGPDGTVLREIRPSSAPRRDAADQL